MVKEEKSKCCGAICVECIHEPKSYAGDCLECGMAFEPETPQDNHLIYKDNRSKEQVDKDDEVMKDVILTCEATPKHTDNWETKLKMIFDTEMLSVELKDFIKSLLAKEREVGYKKGFIEGFRMITTEITTIAKSKEREEVIKMVENWADENMADGDMTYERLLMFLKELKQ